MAVPNTHAQPQEVRHQLGGHRREGEGFMESRQGVVRSLITAP